MMNAEFAEIHFEIKKEMGNFRTLLHHTLYVSTSERVGNSYKLARNIGSVIQLVSHNKSVIAAALSSVVKCSGILNEIGGHSW